MKIDFKITNTFSKRHIGPNEAELSAMLQLIGTNSLDALIDETIPKDIRLTKPLELPEGVSEFAFVAQLQKLAKKNRLYKSYIGLGYAGCIVPAVIQRNIFENPGWYTQYTPYQAEISQGRLEALLNFQTMVMDLTGMEVANASLLDEGTAAAEAMTMLFRCRSREHIKNGATTFLVSDKCLPQTIDILKTRAEPMAIELRIGDFREFDFNPGVYGALVQYPDADGEVVNYSDLIDKAHAAGALVTVAADLLSLTLLRPPGEIGADVVVGSSQRFGVPLGYGGPHAAFFATRDAFKRQMPGRIIGVSVDAQGNPAYRMALQTREQHIRREKATSNICTAQALLAIMASMYAVYHGPEGLRAIAERVHALTRVLENELTKLGYKQTNELYFDTLRIQLNPFSQSQADVRKAALEAGINFRYIDKKHIGITLDETTQPNDVQEILNVFGRAAGMHTQEIDFHSHADNIDLSFPEDLSRKSRFLQHPVFNAYHSETNMMRYIKRLENRDLSLTASMIPLGSCTMKLNAASEMMPVSWPEFSGLHPFVPVEQALGYQEIFKGLEAALCKITGFEAVSLQPNSGAQGEYTGLLVIRAYHKDRGHHHRNVVLIPSSAHGTNPASAVMTGMKVVIVKCDEQGNIDVEDLRSKAVEHKEHLSALMVTYPSTHGVFESRIREICSLIHDNGGQVYMDGANLNAQVGFTNPALIGADVCHLNLHKTFSIPHGGGGPGMGPIAVAKHLAPYLPSHPLVGVGGEKGIPAVSATPWGSPSILLISYAYVKMLGRDGLVDATRYAILNANYIAARLHQAFPVLYKGEKNRVAHEMIFDLRPFKAATGVEVEDVAKRLMDYGFHAPTVSFPVPGTMMVEPTESESRAELDRFCDALLQIRKEIQEIADGEADSEDNVLKNAPHTAEAGMSDQWNHPYSRQKALYPLPYLRADKFWPPVGRIDNAYGDRNLVCACPPVAAYEDE
ncbi:MAG: aminomethyl-transferring glycine dehydrogenase [bacterium]